MSYSEDLRGVAGRVIWFEGVEDALRYPKRFLAYLMTYGTVEDIAIARKYFSGAEFEAALLDPVPGIFDTHSWSYWNIVYHHIPVPPMPERKLG